MLELTALVVDIFNLYIHRLEVNGQNSLKFEYLERNAQVADEIKQNLKISLIYMYSYLRYMRKKLSRNGDICNIM